MAKNLINKLILTASLTAGTLGFTGFKNSLYAQGEVVGVGIAIHDIFTDEWKVIRPNNLHPYNINNSQDNSSENLKEELSVIAGNAAGTVIAEGVYGLIERAIQRRKEKNRLMELAIEELVKEWNQKKEQNESNESWWMDKDERSKKLKDMGLWWVEVDEGRADLKGLSMTGATELSKALIEGEIDNIKRYFNPEELWEHKTKEANEYFSHFVRGVEWCNSRNYSDKVRENCIKNVTRDQNESVWNDVIKVGVYNSTGFVLGNYDKFVKNFIIAFDELYTGKPWLENRRNEAKEIFGEKMDDVDLINYLLLINLPYGEKVIEAEKRVVEKTGKHSWELN